MMMLMNGNAGISRWLQLFRVTNLLIIFLTQVLAWYFIIRPFYGLSGIELQMGVLEFSALIIATIAIAGGGYIVNDIHDIDVDDFSRKPNIIGRGLSIQSAWGIYAIVNLVGIALGFFLALKAGSFQLGFIFPVIAGMLYLYSSRYQYRMLWGNLIVAISSALVILMVWLFEFMFLRETPDDFVRAMSVMPAISTFIWSYALFAFLVSLIREFIKDCQDMAGDQRFGSYNLAIALGIPAMKVIVAAGIILSMTLLAIGQFYLWKHGYRFGFWFLLLTVQFMFAYLLVNIIGVRKPEDFSAPSQLAKFIILAGVLSMQLIYLDIA